ncbi:MAG: hypothetical protein P4L34_03285 [Paludibacter sp.]|nr:hypothetical protein [Paludibacter sp.]
MKSIKFYWQKYAPQSIQSFVKLYTDSKLNRARRMNLLNNNMVIRNKPTEIEEAMSFLKTHRFSPLPYFWSLKYDNFTTEIYFDEQFSFHYIFFERKKLYFPKQYTRFQILWTMRGILKEQDKNSPHCYLTDEFQVGNGSIVIDGGVAEGSFSLSIIEKIKKLYLIECKPEWIEALQLTFLPWKDKVEIIGKYLSDSDSEDTVSVDGFIKIDQNENYFIKLDIEGYEMKAFDGMKSFFSNTKSLKMCVCTYHRNEDADNIYKYLINREFICDFSNGYIVFVDENEVPSFRKALIRAEK